MEILLILGVLVGLWLFIRNDQDRIKNSDMKPLSREALQRGVVPGASAAWKAQAGVGLLCFIGSVQEFLNPALPPFEGRRSFLYAALYAALGKFGTAMLWGASALAFAVAAYLKYQTVQRK